jgi:DNA-binding NarL/FixJ family response regulator
MIRVAIVEDDDEIREGLTLLIEGASGYTCTGAFPTAEAAIGAMSASPPDVLLMDIQLPGITGIEGVRRIKRENPDIDVIMLSVREDDTAVFDSLCAGACGYLVKTIAPARLLAAIDEIHAGGSPMSPKIARMVTRSFQRAEATTGTSPLTPRETEILQLLCEAKPYKIIADTLGISIGTVHSHIKSIYRKLEVSSQSEAMIKAFRDGLV